MTDKPMPGTLPAIAEDAAAVAVALRVDEGLTADADVVLSFPSWMPRREERDLLRELVAELDPHVRWVP